MKLITTPGYLLLIDEEAKIIPNKTISLNLEGDISMSFPFTPTKHVIKVATKLGKIIAYYPLTKEAKELDSLPLLLNPLDDELLAEKDFIELGYKTGKQDFKVGFVRGFRKAQPKQFSLEDMKKAINMARTGYGYDGDIDVVAYLDMGGIDNYNNEFKFKSEEEIIQSLSTQQLPKEFILGKGKTIEEQIKNGYYVY